MRQAAAAQFQQEHGGGWQVQWNQKTGVPSALLSGKARSYGGPPKQAGRAFLQDHKKLFGIENARRNLEVARSNASKGNTRVLYRQVYQGVPVLNSGYLVAINRAGAVYYVSGDYYPDLKLPSTSPSLSAQAVVRHMRNDLEATGPTDSFKVVKQPELVVYVDKGKAGDSVDRADSSLTYHLAYVAEAERRSPLAAFKYIIDAQSGEMLYKTSLVEDAGRHGSGGGTEAAGRDGAMVEHNAASNSAMVNGSGEVYRTNPLHGSPVSETLHRLRDRSPRALYGYGIDINDRFGNDATSSTGEFDYSPSNFRFDQVMVYYHSDDFEAWLTGRLGWNDDTGEVGAETRSDDGYAGSYPSSEETYYSDGSGSAFRNPTREASVMAHEHMHIVSENYDDLNHGFVGDALDEGYSDYFAVAYRHDRQGGQSTEVGEYALVSSTIDVNRQLDNNFTQRRNVDHDDDGDEDFYDASLVFTGALWDFTTDVATDVQEAATITLGSLQYLDGDPSFFDARNALLTAADGTGNSQYECDIRHAFADHGIGTGVYTHITSGPTTLDEGETGTWTASVYCPDGSPSFTWHVDTGGGFYQVGTGSSLTWGPGQVSSTKTIDLKVVVSAGGESNSAQWPVIINDGGGGCNAASNQICQSAQEKTSALGSRALPDTLRIGEVAPTPTRTRARLKVTLPQSKEVRVAVYNTLGRRVRQVRTRLSAGWHTVPVDVTGLSSGMYFARVTVGAVTETRRIVVVR